MSALAESMATAIQALETTPSLLRGLIGTLSVAELDWKPAPERWSASEVLAHLEHVERHNLGLRARRIVEEQLPELVDYDPHVEYARGSYSGRAAPDQLERFCAVRDESVRWLRGLPETAFEREGRHPEVGPIRLSQLVSLWAFHDHGHLRQLAELVRAQRFWDGIGSLQKYYSVSP